MFVNESPDDVLETMFVNESPYEDVKSELDKYNILGKGNDATEMTRKSKIWNEMLLKNPNRVRPERVRRGRLRRVSKILETRGNFDEVSEIKKSTIFFETSRQKKFSITTKFFSSLNRAVKSYTTNGFRFKQQKNKSKQFRRMRRN